MRFFPLLLLLTLVSPSEGAAAAAGTSASGVTLGAEPLTTQRRGARGGGGQRGGRTRRAPSGSRQRSISGRAPTPGSLLGAGRSAGPVDVVPERPDIPLLEDFVQRAPEPDLGEETFLELADAERLDEWFATADYDDGGWISYREASSAMEFDRPRFRLYDPDRDGRLDREEFEYFYTDSMRLFGAFLAPDPAPVPTKAPPRTAEQLRNAYDTDLDEALSLFELARLLRDYRRLELDAGEVLRFVDTTGDERLDVSELVELQGYLYPVTTPVETAEEMAAVPTSLAELFDDIEPRGVEIGGTPYPPRILGPIHPFRRLDLDGDEFVSAEDLEELLRPVRLGIRPRAVLNTLDRDGDGKLSFRELEQALIDNN